jgi:hypothetical protein
MVSFILLARSLSLALPYLWLDRLLKDGVLVVQGERALRLLLTGVGSHTPGVLTPRGGFTSPHRLPVAKPDLLPHLSKRVVYTRVLCLQLDNLPSCPERYELSPISLPVHHCLEDREIAKLPMGECMVCGKSRVSAAGSEPDSQPSSH